MKALYPPLGDPASLPRRVICFAPHADDEVFGCGAMLAYHAARGDEVRVVVLTDGMAGDPSRVEDDIVAVREQESRAAGRELGVRDHRFLAISDGQLGQCSDLAERIRAELEEFSPELVYGPSPQEMHPDHRAASQALIEALAATVGEDARSQAAGQRVLLYGVNAQVISSVLFDVTPYFERKRAAIECFRSQMRYHDLVGKAMANDRSRTINIEDREILYVEGFVDVPPAELETYRQRLELLHESVHGSEASDGREGGGEGAPAAAAGNGSAPGPTEGTDLPRATAVISTWNKADVLRENLDSLRAQSLPFESIVVVDNASTDDTAEIVAREYPEVRLVVMPHSKYGACETFNIGFSSATTPLIAILDDDITLPPTWLEKTTARMMAEPETTAVVSTKVVEPGMPEEYRNSPAINRERYMSTFRGCGSLARREALAQAGYYDERLFIYGNERDLTCRLLNRGYRVLQYPEVETFHKTPFGIQMGKRSLFYHARNAWLCQLKYAPLSELVRMPFLVVSRVLLRRSSKEAEGGVTDATGTIGIARSIRSTKGAWWVLFKAGLSILYNLPYCLKHREPVRSPDFELPLH